MKNWNIFIRFALCSAFILTYAYSCSTGDSDYSGDSSGTGKGGSMARFTITGNHLYAVDYQTLKTVRLEDPQHPRYLELRDQELNFDIETIFPYEDKLFIGSQTGMYIYDISNPEFPQQLSVTTHFSSCDPVVATEHYAYVTLNSGNASCWRGRNELQVYDIADLARPALVGQPLPMSSPKGLGADEEAGLLFVCDRGIKAFDISDPAYPKLCWDLTDIPEAYGIETYDCIPMNGVLLVIGKDGLYQFDYSDRENIQFLSKIDLRK